MAELVIVGGGIMGLWAGVHAVRAGMETLVLDASWPGAGASGGLLGALMPHLPERWNEKKQLQLEALASLEDEIAALEAATGLSAGYARTGRILPLAKPHHRALAEARATEAETRWRVGGRSFSWKVADRPDVEGWPSSQASAAGVVVETLAGRLSPRATIAMLCAFIERAPNAAIRRGARVVSVDGAARQVMLEGGERIGFGDLVIAAGPGAFPLIDGLVQGASAGSGRPVKGQAALLDGVEAKERLVLFQDGLYIVPHDNGTVAIGSTSEDEFVDPATTDSQLDDLLARALALAPALAGGRVVERWAGLRPRAIGREPMVGRLAEHSGVHVLAGGFKVSFGLAHLLAEAVVDDIVGRPAKRKLPASFDVGEHVRLMRQA
ncbi:Glycine/D-amino acid oxidase [Rhizobium sp. RU20A]|uniref:NAD(P)/FAD-dependent oxidoreductase n=1 Tax=Rhizobium sp. RU20A TaxID=1907412 RepID=UPI0009574ED5|nr:FAD-binding oxidoreductase [Rhizobium sp. RU20A]SIQ29187.1 Glycine/D-amino acid oxidase [Rhizobium sp. RU20A]